MFLQTTPNAGWLNLFAKQTQRFDAHFPKNDALPTKAQEFEIN